MATVSYIRKLTQQNTHKNEPSSLLHMNINNEIPKKDEKKQLRIYSKTNHRILAKINKIEIERKRTKR